MDVREFLKSIITPLEGYPEKIAQVVIERGANLLEAQMIFTVKTLKENLGQLEKYGIGGGVCTTIRKKLTGIV